MTHPDDVMAGHDAVPQPDTNNINFNEGEAMRLNLQQQMDAMEQQMDAMDPPAKMTIAPKQTSQDDILP